MPLKFLYDIIVTKITLTKIVLVANAHAGPSNNARPAFEMTAIALRARYALSRSYYTRTMITAKNRYQYSLPTSSLRQPSNELLLPYHLYSSSTLAFD
jgi:hypothetical protein